VFKICFFITSLSTGGAEMMLYRFLQKLDKKTFSPIVISLSTSGEVGRKIECLGVKVYSLEISSVFFNPLLLLRAVKIIRDHRTELVHTWMYHADLFGSLAARLGGIKNIAWGIHQSNLSPKFNKFSTLIIIRICSKLSGLIPKIIFSCSKRAIRTHCDYGYTERIMKFIPNGVDVSSFSSQKDAKFSVKEELNIDEHVSLVGVVSRFDPQKNIIGLIHAAEKVCRLNKNCQFLLVGPGIDSENEKINTAISSSGFNDFFHLLGNRDDIPRLMSSFDVLVLPSHGEAFPCVLVESMACETPCVVTDVGDAAEIVGDTGLVVPVGDMTALASGILQILSLSLNQHRQLGRLARERIERNYEIGLVVRQYEEMYQSMLA
jgi:glycosyltransferase involved in cell wall biosynthesis